VIGENGNPYVTHYDAFGRVDWSVGGGFMNQYGYWGLEVEPIGSRMSLDEGGRLASYFRQWIHDHPGLPMDLDDRQIYEVLERINLFH